MKTHFQRTACLFLAVVLSVTMISYAAPRVAAASSTTLEVDYLPDMVTSWESTFYSWGTSILGSFYEDTFYQACWDAIDRCFAGYLGRCSSMTALQNRCTVFNNTIKKQWTASTLLYGLASAGKYPVVQVAYVSSLGAYSLVDVNNGLVLVNSVGAYTWYKEVSDPETDTYQNRKDIWLPISTATKKTQVSVLTKDSLSDLCVTVNQTDRTCSVRDTYINKQRFYIIIDTSNNIYANADGVPYVAHYPKWSCGGTELYIEDYGENGFMFSATFNGDPSAAHRAVEEYRQILLQSGFRQAGQYPSIEQLFKRIDGVVYNADTEHCFDGDPDTACIGFYRREPYGGFDYVKPEPKKKASFKDLFGL